MTNIRLGTRKSNLALKQTNIVINLIQNIDQNLNFELFPIITLGDKDLSFPKNDESLKDKFVREIEVALLENKIDLAIHSLKDLPVIMPSGLEIPFFPEREDARDCLIANTSFENLPNGAKIGTSSLRRMYQLKNLRPDLQIEPIRGNINTRIAKWQSGEFDGIVIAYAGVKRLDLQHFVTTIFALSQIVPAPGQGMLGIQMRENDQNMRKILAPIHNEDAALAVKIEIELNRLYGGGCHTPFGAFINIDGDYLDLHFYCYEGGNQSYEIVINNRYLISSFFEELAKDIQTAKGEIK